MSRRQPDHYTRKAKEAGYAARSVYKLEEIDQRVQLLRPGMKVLDLGCAPGSWIRYAAQKVGPRGRVVGIDRRAIDFKAPHVTTLVGDIFETEPEVFFDAGGGRFDVVMSDMAPDTCGDRFTDHVRSVELCRRALTLADALGAPGGAFVCKVFEGEDVAPLVDEIRARYAKVRRIKPKSTRSESVELFVVGQARRPERGAEGGE
ncbi:MAG: RlmE family RNA methyltransferase [Myxococcales bacterium]|nr:RlmE family RNA methyltransferase [Myxococcales bacterium]